jgi:signal transduction histidine kinase
MTQIPPPSGSVDRPRAVDEDDPISATDGWLLEPDEPIPWRDRLSRLAAARDGTDDPDLVSILELDRVAAFRPAILAIRWGTTAVSVALAAEGYVSPDLPVVAWGVVIVVYTVLRTFRPIRYTGDIRSLVEVLSEVALLVAAVAMTGYWESPYVFSLLTAIIVAGFARGFGFGIRIGLVCALGITIPFLAHPDVDDTDVRLSAQWSVSLVLVGLVAGYARRISGEADRQHSLALDRMGRLADANALLFNLHRVTQTLPASLEMGDVLDTTMTRLRGLFDFDTAAVLLLDDTDTSWEVIRKEGSRLPLHLDQTALPPPLQRAIEVQGGVAVGDLQGEEGPGLSGKLGSGLYTVLAARGSVIGLLALEARVDDAYTPQDLELLRAFVEPVALAIDNARWFSRLRTVGADEERTRIARDLHDRIGQSLAYLAFELDRIVSKDAREEAVAADLEQLRSDVRGVIGEVRDTLYDLRTDVSEAEDISKVLREYAERVQARSTLDIEVTCDARERLAILQEREMWRIAQEAITNAERHSEASRLQITWSCTADRSILEVSDNGRGFPLGKAGRLDSYGIIGMRERASSIGASLDLLSNEGNGTTVRCVIDTSP